MCAKLSGIYVSKRFVPTWQENMKEFCAKLSGIYVRGFYQLVRKIRGLCQLVRHIGIRHCANLSGILVRDLCHLGRNICKSIVPTCQEQMRFVPTCQENRYKTLVPTCQEYL